MTLDTANTRISVIVPVYNAEAYLRQCVESILRQTDEDWELLLIDDGSTDGSTALCAELSARDRRIILYRQENAGVSAARNTGIRRATGAFLCFVDADDWVEPDYLAVLRRTLGDAQIAVCGVDGAENESLVSEQITLEQFRGAPSRYAKNVYLNCPCNRLFRRELIVGHDLAMPTGMKRGEDAFFMAAYLEQCSRVAVTDRVLYHYRVTPDSAMHRFYTGVCRDEKALMERQYAFFHPNGPHSLAPEEETAFRVWEYGKVLSVCRYIRQYAGSETERTQYLREWIGCPPVRRCLRHAPSTLGKKAATLRIASALGFRGVCVRLMSRLR